MYSMTPLMWAVLSGNHKHVRLLLRKGANELMKDSEGKTALHFATSNTHIRSVDFLISKNQSLPSLKVVINNNTFMIRIIMGEQLCI